MRTRIGFLLALIILSFGCEPKRKNVKGHWHTIYNSPSGDEYYYTLDIDASILQANKHCVSRMIYNPFQVTLKGKSIFPSSFLDYASNISLKKDTLTINNEMVYVRYDLKECRKKDLFCNLEVSIDLESSTKKSLPFDSLSSMNISFINVGKIKQQFESIYSIKKDSFLIAIGGGFIELNEVERFISVEFDKIESGEARDSLIDKQLYIAINADSEAPKFLIDSVYSRINKVLESEQILLTTFNEEKNRLEFERR